VRRIPGQAAGPAPRVRPRTVSAALAVLFAAVVLLVLLAGLALAEAGYTRGLIDRAASASGTTGAVVSGERSFIAAFAAVVVIILVGMAAYYAGFAIPLSRGRNYARIAVWAGVGIPLFTGLFCGLGGLLSRADDPASQPAADPAEARFYAELDRLRAEESPVWMFAVGTALVLLGSLIAVVVLLRTPSSNRYFRPGRPAARQPLLPVYAYPLFPPPYAARPAPISPPAAGRIAPPPGDRTQ
jgi:hypothetical protein